MSTYTHIEDGGTYRRSPLTVKLKLSGDTEWREVVAYYCIDEDALGSMLMFVTDEERWAERFRKNEPPTPEEWAETVKGLAADFDCGACWDCLDDPTMGMENPTMRQFIACPECGNKRCPHGTNHNNACTDSNEPNQPGSRYGGLPRGEE